MFSFKRPSVLVGMSGGVDSSVAAALLKQRGFRVVGGFIRNWSDSEDPWTGECAWKSERRDALRVAAYLDIPLKTFDFEKAYRSRVVDEMVSGYAAGRTPNPDVLCNEVIKFGLFADAARSLGFGHVATGHYARIRRGWAGHARLLRGTDPEKDQSYFLYRVPQDVLRRCLFPIGHLIKQDVRELASDMGLPVASKPDSQGICFIGKLDMSDFLKTRIDMVPGDIVDSDGHVIGRHDGLATYTIGQRHGMRQPGGPAWYVASKDIATNRLIVVDRDDHPALFSTELVVADVHWTRGRKPTMPLLGMEVQVRYRQNPVNAEISAGPSEGTVRVRFDRPVKAAAPGQSAVFYRRDECIGGGTID
ncbi:tRNA 2-thiouridine(34) synthase MnmA [Patescibacteria group bacterium]|nr:tRNA 2-thiouridine(34) synthase MnmA [Patescibacteria group bacterium]MBU2613468.1 tRNA 2-thiouridine(34) synthase MnmA [Patescibacteria group bacterium]